MPEYDRALVGAEEPALEKRGHPVHSRHSNVGGVSGVGEVDHPVFVAELSETVVPPQASMRIRAPGSTPSRTKGCREACEASSTQPRQADNRRLSRLHCSAVILWTKIGRFKARTNAPSIDAGQDDQVGRQRPETKPARDFAQLPRAE